MILPGGKNNPPVLCSKNSVKTFLMHKTCVYSFRLHCLYIYQGLDAFHHVINISGALVSLVAKWLSNSPFNFASLLLSGLPDVIQTLSLCKKGKSTFCQKS